MNLKKLLTLSAAVLMVGTTAVGCGNKKEETLKTAAEYIWQMYKGNDEKSLTGSFDVVNKVLVGEETVAVTWNIEATGSVDAFKVEAKNDNFSTIKIGYYDGLVKEDSTVKLTPTFTLGKKSLTLADVYEEEAKHAFNFTTPKLVLNNHADWDAAKKGDTLTVKGTVVDVVATGSSTGSVYMVDDQGNGYYIYNPTSKGAKSGDVIIATGKKTVYNGQEETEKGGSYQVVSKAEISSIPVVNASADWAAASTNKVQNELGDKYQNIPVKLEKCTPTRVEGAYYYFKVGNSNVEYNVYDNTYFLTAEEIAAWKAIFNDAIAKGYTLTIEGISTVYSNAYQIYPSSIAKHVVTKEAELSVDEKHNVVKEALLGAIEAEYDANAEIAFKVPSYAEVTLAVTSPAENATVSVKDGKILVAPSPVATENKVTATIKIGESTKTVELTVKTAVLKYDGYKVKVVTSDLVEGKEPQTKVVTKEAKTYDSAKKIDVTYSVNNLYADYGAVYFNKTATNDTLTISVPEGYLISKLEMNQYGKSSDDAWSFHAGADLTAAVVASTKVNDASENKAIRTVLPNSQHVTIDNKSTQYNTSFYDITLTIVEKGVNLTAENLLGWAGGSAQVAYDTATKEATVNGTTFKYIQTGCYGNGLQMRTKNGSSATVWNATAIEGIKGVKLVHNADKTPIAAVADAFKFEFSKNADFSDAVVVKLTTTADKTTYEVAPESGEYKYVRMTHTADKTFYWDTISVLA